ncbi:MAG: hypothetical protein H6686_02125 [Fibrobacteria bacterium]|nr:hypothetical protein [Fibrobacteria bacterium]
MADLNRTWLVHAVLAGPAALRPTDPAPHLALELPQGSSATRWLSGGVSLGRGWPLRAENLLNREGSRHVVLNLASESFPEAAWFDELHPRFPEGLPRIARLVEETRGRLSDLGLRSRPGGLVVSASTLLPPEPLRKIQQVARRLGLEPFVAGLAESGLPPHPPRDAREAEDFAQRASEMLRALEGPQPKAAKTSRAKPASSGSRAPIE